MSGAFSPGRTVLLSVGPDSVSAAIDEHAPVVRLVNMGPEVVFVRVGTGEQTATEEDFPVLPGVATLLMKGVGADGIAAIADGADAQELYITVGS